MSERSERRLAAILAADVAGYSRLVSRDEESAVQCLREHIEGVLPIVAAHAGRVVDTAGDGLLAEFPSAVRATEAAIAIQRQMEGLDADRPSESQMRFRIGVNVGDVMVDQGKLYGDGVNVAARLEQLADPGGVLVSGTVHDSLQGKIALPLEYMGEQHVKNIPRPIRTYRVRIGDEKRSWLAPLRRHRQKLPTLAAALLLVGLVGGATWWFWPIAPAKAAPSVAVLPFDNLSGDPADRRVSDGLTEDIITDLSRYRDFTVIARDSTEVYRGKPADVRTIGKDLDVSHVLEGSYQRDGNQVRITAQLIDAATGAHVWSERYDRPAGEVFAIQSEVSDRIANSLGGSGGRLAGSVLTSARRKLPRDLNAYELYLLGWEKSKVGQSRESQLEAQRLLHQALKIDPLFARAHTTLAWTYSWLETLEADTKTLTGKMRDEASRAVELDPMDAVSHEALGFAYALNGDLGRAEIQFDEALRLNPNSFEILAVYGCMAHNFGKAQEGAAGVDRAQRLNPVFPSWAIPCFRLAMVMVGRYDDALRIQARQPEEQWNSDGFVMTAGSLAMLGKTDEAKALVRRGLVKFPGLLSVEKFALNRSWSPTASAIMADLMRRAGFPLCASDEDLALDAKPVRLPECNKT